MENWRMTLLNRLYARRLTFSVCFISYSRNDKSSSSVQGSVFDMQLKSESSSHSFPYRSMLSESESRSESTPITSSTSPLFFFPASSKLSSSESGSDTMLLMSESDMLRPIVNLGHQISLECRRRVISCEDRLTKMSRIEWRNICPQWLD